MKSTLHLCCFLSFIILCPSAGQAAAADTNPPPRLTVELRDGSRVTGESVEKYFKFRTALLGEIKLDVKDIRLLDCSATKTTKLTTAKGDSLTVTFVDSEFALKTSFGKVALPVSSVRKISVSTGRSTVAHPAGLVALWSGEGDGADSSGGNTATLTDLNFDEGKVGRAFAFNGTTSYIKIPANPSLNVGAGNSFTLSAWIKPADIGRLQPILEWNNGGGNSSQLGVHLYISTDPRPGSLYAEIADINTSWHQVTSRIAPVTADTFQQVALTYDKATGQAKIYFNGEIITQQNLGSITPQTTFNLYLGKRPSDEGLIYTGLMDEVAIYNRALSADEIQSICKEENNGELPPPPAVQPRRPFNGIYRQSFGE